MYETIQVLSDSCLRVRDPGLQSQYYDPDQYVLNNMIGNQILNNPYDDSVSQSSSQSASQEQDKNGLLHHVKLSPDYIHPELNDHINFSSASNTDEQIPLSWKRHYLDPFSQRDSKTAPVKADYIEYDYLHGCVRLHFGWGTYLDPAKSLDHWLNFRCLYMGSSLNGRKDAARSLLETKKFLPVLVSMHPFELWMPLTRQNATFVIYCNVAQISYIEFDSNPQKNRCRIHFQDGLILENQPGKQTERNFIQSMRLKHIVQMA